MSERRRHPRYRVSVPVRLHVGKRPVDGLVENVTPDGLFVRCESPPAVRQLVRIEAALPPDGTAFEGHGLVVYSADPGSGKSHGVGLQLYGTPREAKQTWDGFVAWSRAHHAALSMPPVSSSKLPAVPAPAAERRPESDPVLRIQPASAEALYALWSRGVSRGTITLGTGRALAIGQAVSIDVVHPRTALPFRLRGVVRRVERSAEGWGAEIDVSSSGTEAAADFAEFVQDGVPVADDDAMLLGDEEASAAERLSSLDLSAYRVGGPPGAGAPPTKPKR